MPVNNPLLYAPAKIYGPGALIRAVEDNDVDTVKALLLQKNADVNERDSRGNTPLSLAANYGYLDIVRVLLDKNANVDSRNAAGNTPLMTAVSSYSFNRDMIVRLLLGKNAAVDIRNNDGDTAMSLAVKKQRPSIVTMLKDEDVKRKKLADEFAKAAAEKRRAETAARQEKLREMAKKKPRPGLLDAPSANQP